MAWGEPHGPDAAQLADRLASAVRCFEEHPSTANRERMLQACQQYERSAGPAAPPLRPAAPTNLPRALCSAAAGFWNKFGG